MQLAQDAAGTFPADKARSLWPPFDSGTLPPGKARMLCSPWPVATDQSHIARTHRPRIFDYRSCQTCLQCSSNSSSGSCYFGTCHLGTTDTRRSRSGDQPLRARTCRRRNAHIRCCQQRLGILLENIRRTTAAAPSSGTGRRCSSCNPTALQHSEHDRQRTNGTRRLPTFEQSP